MEASRLQQQQMFCKKHGWGNADLFPLPCDASKRSYVRLIDGDRRALLMDAPPEYEDLSAYISIGGHLLDIGLRAPEIYASDSIHGFALIEDFGGDTFTRLLEAAADEKQLYSQAVDVLIHIHNKPAAVAVDVPAYDEKALLLEAELFVDWYVPAVRGTDVTQSEKDRYLNAWQKALMPISADRSTLVLRDYHVDNLMIVGERQDILSCGVLDFQDALIGARAYDLVSLVEDARRDISDDIRQLVLNRYFNAFLDVERSDIVRDMAILGAQRHAKVLGIFTRLSRRDDKHVYLKHIPRVAGLLARCLQIPELEEVRTIIEELVPGYVDIEIEKPLTSLYPE